MIYGSYLTIFDLHKLFLYEQVETYSLPVDLRSAQTCIGPQKSTIDHKYNTPSSKNQFDLIPPPQGIP